jgi:hypothetical protein
MRSGMRVDARLGRLTDRHRPGPNKHRIWTWTGSCRAPGQRHAERWPLWMTSRHSQTAHAIAWEEWRYRSRRGAPATVPPQQGTEPETYATLCGQWITPHTPVPGVSRCWPCRLRLATGTRSAKHRGRGDRRPH